MPHGLFGFQRPVRVGRAHLPIKRVRTFHPIWCAPFALFGAHPFCGGCAPAEERVRTVWADGAHQAPSKDGDFAVKGRGFHVQRSGTFDVQAGARQGARGQDFACIGRGDLVSYAPFPPEWAGHLDL